MNSNNRTSQSNNRRTKATAAIPMMGAIVTAALLLSGLSLISSYPQPVIAQQQKMQQLLMQQLLMQQLLMQQLLMQQLLMQQLLMQQLLMQQLLMQQGQQQETKLLQATRLVLQVAAARLMLLLQEEQQPAGQWLVKVRDQVAVLQ